MKIHHIALKVSNVEKVSQFYQDVVGLKKIKSFKYDDGGVRSVWFEMDSTILMIEDGQENTRNNQGWHLVAFEMELKDRESKIKFLKSKGVKIVNESLYSIYFNDPEGNPLAYSHYPERA